MPYWGSGPTDNDYAFDSIGSYVYWITERMFSDAENVIQKRYPEQSIVASVECLRLLARSFPKCVKLHFNTNKFAKAQEMFGRWLEAVSDQLPSKYRDEIQVNAKAVFDLFETQVLTARK